MNDEIVKENRMRVADYIAKRLSEHGIKHIFMITGGGAMHLNDAFGKNKNFECIFHHHEQACAIAAEGYFKTSGKMALVNVTTGPGGLNTLTGVMGQWTDSIPVLYISGQVKFETTIASCPEIKLRQLGDQEVDIISVVSHLTKFAKMVTAPKTIKKYIDKAIYLATHGRPGPVWLDIPINVQGATIEEKELEEYGPKEDEIVFDKDSVCAALGTVVRWMNESKRPVIIAGHGIRLSGAIEEFFKLVDILKIPVVGTLNGFDIVPSDYKYFAGKIGTIGERAGNFALQNSDLAIFLASRNNIRQISYGWKNFARAAKKVIVDIDDNELKKPTIKPDLAICCDVKHFIQEWIKQADTIHIPLWDGWMDWCRQKRKKYPAALPEYESWSTISPYYFLQKLTSMLEEDSVIVAANATACISLFQAGIVKKGQRQFSNSGCASMGYDLPAAIGACIARGKRDVVCLAGDGSIMMNLQELQTVAYYKLPVKIFVLNNNGYISIRQTQTNFFGKPFVGCDPDSGVGLPNFVNVANAFGIKTFHIDNPKAIGGVIEQVLAYNGPVLCDVKLDQNYQFSPKLSSEKKPDGRIISKPLEDMYPFLDREEFKKEMIIPPLEE